MIILCLILLVAILAHSLNKLRDQKETKVLIYLVIAHLSIGTTFYMSYEGLSVVDSLFYSVMTMATLGYGKLTDDISKVFVMLYILSAIGLFSQFVLLISERERK